MDNLPSKQWCKTGILAKGEKYNQNLHGTIATDPDERCPNGSSDSYPYDPDPTRHSGGKRKSRRNRKSKKGKKSRKARKSRRKSNRRRGRR